MQIILSAVKTDIFRVNRFIPFSLVGSGPDGPDPYLESGCALQALVAFGVVAAALLDPLHAAIAVAGLVGIVLIDAGVHARLAGALLGIFRVDRVREDRAAS